MLSSMPSCPPTTSPPFPALAEVFRGYRSQLFPGNRWSWATGGSREEGGGWGGLMGGRDENWCEKEHEKREREKEERTGNIARGGRGEKIIPARILFTRRLLRVPATPRWHREMDVRSINTPCDKQKKENGGGCVTLKPLKDET